MKHKAFLFFISCTAWLFVQSDVGNYRHSFRTSLSISYSRLQVVCFMHTAARWGWVLFVNYFWLPNFRFLKVLLGFLNCWGCRMKKGKSMLVQNNFKKNAEPQRNTNTKPRHSSCRTTLPDLQFLWEFSVCSLKKARRQEGYSGRVVLKRK